LYFETFFYTSSIFSSQAKQEEFFKRIVDPTTQSKRSQRFAALSDEAPNGIQAFCSSLSGTIRGHTQDNGDEDALGQTCAYSTQANACQSQKNKLWWHSEFRYSTNRIRNKGCEASMCASSKPNHFNSAETTN